MSRDDHILLGNDVVYKTKVCMKNLALFTGFKAKDSYFHKFHLHKIIPATYPSDRYTLDKHDQQTVYNLIHKVIVFVSIKVCFIIIINKRTWRGWRIYLVNWSNVLNKK